MCLNTMDSEFSKLLTAVVLHVGPHVPLLQAVGERAVPDVVALLLLHHVHTHLDGRQTELTSHREAPVTLKDCKNVTLLSFVNYRSPWQLLPAMSCSRTHVILLWVGAGEGQRANNHPLLLLERFHQQDPTFLRPAAEPKSREVQFALHHGTRAVALEG